MVFQQLSHHLLETSRNFLYGSIVDAHLTPDRTGIIARPYSEARQLTSVNQTTSRTYPILPRPGADGCEGSWKPRRLFPVIRSRLSQGSKIQVSSRSWRRSAGLRNSRSPFYRQHQWFRIPRSITRQAKHGCIAVLRIGNSIALAEYSQCRCLVLQRKEDHRTTTRANAKPHDRLLTLPRNALHTRSSCFRHRRSSRLDYLRSSGVVVVLQHLR